AKGLALTDVRPGGVSGLSIYPAGTQITILGDNNRSVGTATASADGTFTTGVSATAARYRAVVGTTSSRALKLKRATTLESVAVKGNIVTLAGRIDLSKAKGKLTLGVQGGRGANACKGGQLKPRGRAKLANGRFTVRAVLPATTGKTAVRVRVS